MNWCQTENDLTRRISNLSLNEENDDETQVHETLILTNKVQQLEAKLKELTQWNKEAVYDEINDNGQECISLRWVIMEKVNNGSKFVKARLCARGFEQEQNFRTDSPSCSREGLPVACCFISSSQWVLTSLDLKTAFLQGKAIERTIYVRPLTTHARVKNTTTTDVHTINKLIKYIKNTPFTLLF